MTSDEEGEHGTRNLQTVAHVENHIQSSSSAGHYRRHTPNISLASRTFSRSQESLHTASLPSTPRTLEPVPNLHSVGSCGKIPDLVEHTQTADLCRDPSFCQTKPCPVHAAKNPRVHSEPVSPVVGAELHSHKFELSPPRPNSDPPMLTQEEKGSADSQERAAVDISHNHIGALATFESTVTDTGDHSVSQSQTNTSHSSHNATPATDSESSTGGVKLSEGSKTLANDLTMDSASTKHPLPASDKTPELTNKILAKVKGQSMTLPFGSVPGLRPVEVDIQKRDARSSLSLETAGVSDKLKLLAEGRQATLYNTVEPSLKDCPVLAIKMWFQGCWSLVTG